MYCAFVNEKLDKEELYEKKFFIRKKIRMIKKHLKLKHKN